MPMTDPMKRDEDAGWADLAAVYEKYGETEAIARERGGEAWANARLAEIQRIDNIWSQCRLLEEPLPKWMEFTYFRIASPKRSLS